MGVALITPFKEDDSVDYEALLRLVDYQLQNGTDFLCVLGTTAETPTLTKEEKDKIKHLVVERVNGRIPILLGSISKLHVSGQAAFRKSLGKPAGYTVEDTGLTTYRTGRHYRHR